MKFGIKKKTSNKQEELVLTKEVPFAIEEAYKSLRTNLLFSLPEEKCKIIEITSSVQNEGKSVTAINLAIALGKNGSKVLLIDCDLRLPTIARKLKVKQKPGLTNLLYGMCNAQDIINHLECGIDVIPSGDLPPNPSETLGSSRMKKTLEFMTNVYDYIILDAPPIGVVTDAAVLAKQASGVILVVRKEVASYEGVDVALNKLKIANANILGFVLTDAETNASNYGNYGYSSNLKRRQGRFKT